jgi:prepilin peptidase CpaA
MLTAAAVLLQAILLALLARIAWTDLDRQKIGNRDVLALALLGAANLATQAVQTGIWSSLTIGAIAGAILFAALFPFWLLRKVGAGDVKLMGAALFVTGGDHLFVFALILLAFSLLTVAVARNPLLLPQPFFRKYIQTIEGRHVVPFGVPIAASLAVVLLLQFFGLVGRAF